MECASVTNYLYKQLAPPNALGSNLCELQITTSNMKSPEVQTLGELRMRGGLGWAYWRLLAVSR